MKASKITRRAFFEWSVRSGVCAALGYPILIEPNWPVLEKVEVPIAGLSPMLEGLRIGLLADFHKGLYVTEGDIKSAVKLLQKQHPDIILLAGDFVEGDAKHIHSVAPILSKMKAPMGTYAVLGNHDYWTDPIIVRNVLQEYKIPVLLNESVEIQSNGESFYIVGLDDAWEGQPSPQKALKDIPNDALKILLVHEPDYADSIKDFDSWIPLQVSGHSHGGQVIFPFIGPPFLPYLGKSYPMGLKRVAGSDRWVYTTRGVGNILPIRFNCKPEVTLIKTKGSSVNDVKA